MENDEAFVWPDRWQCAIPAVKRLVSSICRRYELGPSDVEDMVQTALTRLVIEADARKRHFESVALLCGWVGAYVRSQIRELKGKQNRERPKADLEVSSPRDHGAPSGQIAEYLSLLDEPRHQEVLSLYFDEHLTFSQIADRLGCSRSQVHKLHQAAIELLRRRLAQ